MSKIKALHSSCTIHSVCALLTFLVLVFASIHISQCDVCIAQALDSLDHPASLFPDCSDDLLSYI